MMLAVTVTQREKSITSLGVACIVYTHRRNSSFLDTSTNRTRHR